MKLKDVKIGVAVNVHDWSYTQNKDGDTNDLSYLHLSNNWRIVEIIRKKTCSTTLNSIRADQGKAPIYYYNDVVIEHVLTGFRYNIKAAFLSLKEINKAGVASR